MKTFKLIPVLLILALAACVSSDPTPSANIPVGRSDLGPGAQEVDGLIAATMFRRVCVDTAPSFARARSEIAAMPFVQHPETGTYYHRNLNLSFKLLDSGPKRCSIVFGSNESAGQLAIFMATSTGSQNIAIDPSTNTSTAQLPNGAQFGFEKTSRYQNTNYYNAFIQARR